MKNVLEDVAKEECIIQELQEKNNHLETRPSDQFLVSCDQFGKTIKSNMNLRTHMNSYHKVKALREYGNEYELNLSPGSNTS